MIMTSGAVPFIPAGQMAVNIHVKPGVAFTARAFDGMVAGADKESAPRAFQPHHGVRFLDIDQLFLAKRRPNIFQTA